MKKIQLFLLVACTLCFVTNSFSQKGDYDIINGFGIFGGMTKVNLATDNFTTTDGNGFIGGFSATVEIPHKWYNMSYGMHLSESTISILGRPTAASTANEFVDYKLFAAQLALMIHMKLAGSYVTFDLGPMVQYNSQLEFEDATQEGYFINNYDNLSAADISNISRFNLNGAAGLTAGFKFVKLRAHYIYSATNILKNLEREAIDTSGGDTRFKGNMSMVLFGVMFSF